VPERPREVGSDQSGWRAGPEGVLGAIAPRRSRQTVTPVPTTGDEARPHRFEGLNALVTGASRGIGAATAERLAAEGANVALVARPPSRSADAAGSLDETATRLRAYGTTVVTIEADLAEPAGREAIVPAAVELLGGPIDILVNNAARNMAHTLLDYSLERRHAVFELNLNAPVDLTQAVLADMIAAGQGWIVNVSSGAARHAAGPPFGLVGLGRVLGVYGASKAALNRITNAFAAELEGTGVRVNTVEPRGAVLSEGAAARGVDMIAPENFESMEAMVEATVWLCGCPADRTGLVHVSLDLLDQIGATVWALDASTPYAGGYRRLEGPSSEL
jgi:citronellol/citronellal dehydrogenase